VLIEEAKEAMERSRLLDEMVSYNTQQINDIKSSFANISSNTFKVLCEYLDVYKFIFVRQSLINAKTIDDIRYRDGGLNIIEFLRNFYSKMIKEEYSDRVSGSTRNSENRMEYGEWVVK
jgi:hypothetical protein